MRAIEANLSAGFSSMEYQKPAPKREGKIEAFPGDHNDPSPIYLIDGEKIHTRTLHEFNDTSVVHPEEALLSIAQVDSLDDVGLYPVLAAVPTEENKGKKELELFQVPFGRDSILMSNNEIKENPQIAKKTILVFAASQGVAKNQASEEEVGKIVHEDRDGNDEVARRITDEKGWGWPYYGSVDATPAFVNLVDLYIKSQNGDQILYEKYIDKNSEEQTVKHAVERSVNWLEKRLEKSPAGLLEYKKEQDGGIENPFWRDSREAVHHEDGRIADNTFGISSFSVQIEAYNALQAASRLFPEKADKYLAKASNLKRRIMDFWVEDERGGYFAIGAERKEDNSYELLKIRTSDMGHILNSDILEGDDSLIVEKREKLINTLFSPEMFGTSGIRTLSKNELRYNEGAYHNGSVWPRENNLIADGLAKHGYLELAYQLHKRNARIWEILGIFPEKVSGDDSPSPKLSKRTVEAIDPRREIYKLEQPGQELQGWSITGIRNSLRYIDWYEKQMAA